MSDMSRHLSARTYPSKVDAWFVVLLCLSLATAVAGLIMTGVQEGLLRAAQGGFILLGVAGFLVWILLGTTYTLDGDRLIVRSGPLRWTIALADITGAGKPHGLFRRGGSSPALSWDRLVISYGAGKRLMISPENQEHFLADLKARQQTLRISSAGRLP
jgi:hypothetical protein